MQPMFCKPSVLRNFSTTKVCLHNTVDEHTNLMCALVAVQWQCQKWNLMSENQLLRV